MHKRKIKSNYLGLIKKYIRPKSRCELCGTRYNLTIHHIIARSKNGSNERWNLAILCSDCHNNIEDMDFDTIREYKFYISINSKDIEPHEEKPFVLRPSPAIFIFTDTTPKESKHHHKKAKRSRWKRCWRKYKGKCIIKDSIAGCNCQSLFWCKGNPVTKD